MITLIIMISILPEMEKNLTPGGKCVTVPKNGKNVGPQKRFSPCFLLRIV